MFPALLRGPDAALHQLVAQLVAGHRQMETAQVDVRRAMLAIADSTASDWTPLTPG